MEDIKIKVKVRRRNLNHKGCVYDAVYRAMLDADIRNPFVGFYSLEGTYPLERGNRFHWKAPQHLLNWLRRYSSEGNVRRIPLIQFTLPANALSPQWQPGNTHNTTVVEKQQESS